MKILFSGMKYNALYRSIIYCIVILFSISLMTWVEPAVNSLPFGMILPAKKIYPATTANAVSLFPYSPIEYQSLGEINIKLHFRSTTPTDAEKNAVEMEAKRLAATVGANGVIVRNYGETAKQSGPASQLIIFTGTAIKR